MALKGGLNWRKCLSPCKNVSIVCRSKQNSWKYEKFTFAFKAETLGSELFKKLLAAVESLVLRAVARKCIKNGISILQENHQFCS